MNRKINYQFTSKVWNYSSSGTGSWQFVSLSEEMSSEIRNHFQWQEEGWGRMKIVAKIEDTEWNTAIWFDTKLNTYILPIKAVIRKKLKIQVGDQLLIAIFL